MKVNRLAGARRLSLPPADPQFRWTLKTWIKKSWKETDYSHYSSRKVNKFDNFPATTMTVIARTEAEAKRKVEAALPAVPPNEGVDWEADDRVTYERHWSLEAEVVEVER